jgi:hypothetical protein
VSESPKTLLRFVLPDSHPDTGVRGGIFWAAYALRRDNEISVADRKSLDDLLAWFRVNLAVPDRFNRSKSKGYYRRRTAGISWLKPTASEHLAKMGEQAKILRNNGYEVSKITTDRAGYVVFEDDHQVVAEPFRSEHR